MITENNLYLFVYFFVFFCFLFFVFLFFTVITVEKRLFIVLGDLLSAVFFPVVVRNVRQRHVEQRVGRSCAAPVNK